MVRVAQGGTDTMASPGAGTPPRRRAAWRTHFTINGRFLSQATTGVQRYAREITASLDDLIGQSNGTGALLTPLSVTALPPLNAITVQRIGPFEGYSWEQVVLPVRAAAPLLNLCNTGPALASGQVVCMHDANVFIQPESYSAAFRRVYRLLLPLLVRRAARVTSVSKTSALQLAAHLPIAARDIEILPNGHEHVRTWRAAASRLAATMADARPYVLLLGSRARHKNADFILRQAEALDRRGLDLVVAGGAGPIFARSEAVERSNIRHLGFVSDDDLAFLYSRALCLAFPSLTEGFGLPIVEAMALGCPVVSSDRASMPEVCGDAALLAPPDDAAAWQDHFAALAGSSALREDLRGRGHEQVRQFSWTASARGYLELFGHHA